MYSEDEGQGGQGRRFGRGGRGGGRPFLPKPIKEGDEIDLTIEAMGSRGDGIGKTEGFVVFVPGVQVGETVKVKIKELRGRSAIGEKLE